MAMSVSCRPFRARRGPGRHLGFRRSGSTLGYNPTAASRLPSPNERGSVRFSDVVFSCALTGLVGLVHSYPGFHFAPPWAIILPPLRGSRALTSGLCPVLGCGVFLRPCGACEIVAGQGKPH